MNDIFPTADKLSTKIAKKSMRGFLGKLSKTGWARERERGPLFGWFLRL